MTLQEQFNEARQNMQNLYSSILGFRTTNIGSFTIKTEIYIEDVILSVGVFDDSECPINEMYLHSMLNAIANYDLALIPEE